MAKTLNQFLEGKTATTGYLKVKSPDEQKFVDKHVRVTTAEPAGNGDEVFKASKIKTIERKQGRKGYNPGEDENVYEGLTGSQHKIDANKNGKVDAHDFHLLRKKKKVAEEAEALDELSTEKLLAYRKKAREADTNKHHVYADEADKKIKKKTGVYNPNLLQRAKAKLRNEEAEALDELSTDTMKSYGDKRARTVFSGGRKPGESVDAAINRKSKQSNSLSLARTKINRVQRTGSTVNKESVEALDELSQDKLMDYRAAAKKQGTGIQDKMKIGGGDWSKDGKDTSTLKKRMAGYKMAGRKVRMGEEFIDLLATGEIVFANEEIRSISEREVTLIATVLNRLSEENQDQFCEVALKSLDGFDKMLSFAIQNKGE